MLPGSCSVIQAHGYLICSFLIWLKRVSNTYFLALCIMNIYMLIFVLCKWMIYKWKMPITITFFKISFFISIFLHLMMHGKPSFLSSLINMILGQKIQSEISIWCDEEHVIYILFISISYLYFSWPCSDKWHLLYYLEHATSLNICTRLYCCNLK